ncbi:MAG: HD domain-containing protein [Acidobacteria bacterium]|nr:HD domain-containing protein [Acidobacteriota bacterium]
MKSPMCKDLAPGQNVQGIFLVQSKDVRQKRSGEPYLSLTLMDRSGDVDAKMWDNVANIMDSFERDDFVKVKGEAQLYQNRLQFTIHTLQRVPDSEIDLGDFLPASRRDPKEMWAEFQAVVASIANPHLKALLDNLFSDEKLAAAYRTAPAAKAIHHAWLGGLLEHVLSLCAQARFMARHYPGIDEDLLLTGVVLHDLGKISELEYARSFGYSAEGGLLGHMHIGLRLMAEHLPAGFPPKLRSLVEHMILSHHGQLEYGSPKLPVFPEALLLHHLDNLDSKMAAIFQALERDRATPGLWTGYNAALERSFLDKDKYLAESPAQSAMKPAATAAKPASQNSSPFGQALFSALGGENTGGKES